MIKKCVLSLLICAIVIFCTHMIIADENQGNVFVLKPSTEESVDASKIFEEWKHCREFDLPIYHALKEAVFAKDPSIVGWFNEAYSQPTEEAVLYLAQYIDSIGPWGERYPPFATATIGTEEVYLDGWVAIIIYDKLFGF